MVSFIPKNIDKIDTKKDKRPVPQPLDIKDKCDDFQNIWFNDTALKIILFLMKNKDYYYTRQEIAQNSTIKISTLERYLPKLAGSRYRVILERATGGDKFRANNVKEYRINRSSNIVKTMYLLLKEAKKIKYNKNLI